MPHKVNECMIGVFFCDVVEQKLTKKNCDSFDHFYNYFYNIIILLLLNYWRISLLLLLFDNFYNKTGKFLGICNDQKYLLDECFRMEKEGMYVYAE